MQLNPGDVLVAYSDGMTEAQNSAEEEFGEQRLLDICVQANSDRTPGELLQCLLGAVHRFSAGAPQNG